MYEKQTEFARLQHPQDNQAHHLNRREFVDDPVRNFAHEVVSLGVEARIHRPETEAFEELVPLERSKAHVEEETEEHRHRNHLHQGQEHHRNTDRDVDTKRGDAVLTHRFDLLLAFAGHLGDFRISETSDVVQGVHRRRDDPRQSKQGADQDDQTDDEEIEVIARPLLQLVVFCHLHHS